MEKLVIGVCTRRRPQMLKQCLESLIYQAHPLDIDPVIVVVENDHDPHSRDEILKFRGPIVIFYIHEPRIGISYARNAILDKAKEINAGWIAFIDDDEIADANWLNGLMAKKYRSVPVLRGRHEMICREKMPFWVDINKKPSYPKYEGRSLKTSTCANVRFSTQLICRGLRFNENIGFMGGEDIEFFGRAFAAGFEIKETLQAVTFETVHPERMTLISQFYRALWCSASDVIALQSIRGRYHAIFRKIHTIPINVILGLIEIIISPLFLIGGLTSFKHRVLAGVKRLAKACGRIAAVIGWLPKPYQNVVGN